MSTESWKVVPCPIHHGKHPCHDTRWVMTADAEVEMSDHVPDDWRLTSGSIVCQMRDGDPQDAHLVAAAPELLAALSDIFGHAERTDAADLAELWGRMDDIRDLARAAIAKAQASR